MTIPADPSTPVTYTVFTARDLADRVDALEAECTALRAQRDHVQQQYDELRDAVLSMDPQSRDAMTHRLLVALANAQAADSHVADGLEGEKATAEATADQLRSQLRALGQEPTA